MTIMATGVLLHWTQASSFELVARQTMGVRKGVKTGANPGEAIAPPKTYELTLFTMILYDSENRIRNTRPFLSSIVLWQKFCEVYFISLKVVNPWGDLTNKFYWNRPPNLIGWICPGVKTGICPSLEIGTKN